MSEGLLVYPRIVISNIPFLDEILREIFEEL